MASDAQLRLRLAGRDVGSARRRHGQRDRSERDCKEQTAHFNLLLVMPGLAAEAFTKAASPAMTN